MSEGREKKRVQEWILWITAIAVGILFFLLFQFNSVDGSRIVIQVQSKVIKTCPLHEDNEITIEGKDGGINQLVLRDGEAWIEEASCPDKLCVHQHSISKIGQSIICLPNEVVVEVQGKSDGGEIDAIAE